VTRLLVADVCGAARVSRADGGALRQHIEEHWGESQPTVVDFSGVTIASVSFFDESFGMLALVHPIEDLTRHIKVENIAPPDRKLLNSIVLSRQRERQTRRNGAGTRKPGAEGLRETDPTVRGILSDMVGPPHYTAGNIASRTGLPLQSVLDVLTALEGAGIVERVDGQQGNSTWESIRFGRNLQNVLDAATKVFPDLDEDLSE
jgi:hypothetical protein